MNLFREQTEKIKKKMESEREEQRKNAGIGRQMVIYLLEGIRKTGLEEHLRVRQQENRVFSLTIGQNTPTDSLEIGNYKFKVKLERGFIRIKIEGKKHIGYIGYFPTLDLYEISKSGFFHKSYLGGLLPRKQRRYGNICELYQDLYQFKDQVDSALEKLAKKGENRE